MTNERDVQDSINAALERLKAAEQGVFITRSRPEYVIRDSSGHVLDRWVEPDE